jgi:hypothetical protein
MNKKWILGSLAIAALGAAWACGGTTSATSTDGGADGSIMTNSSSGGGSGGAGSNGSSGGAASSSSSGGGASSSSGGSVTSDGGPVTVVEGGPLPCGQAVCTPPEVCCQAAGNGGGGGATTTCEAPSACKGVSEGCTADTCPAGAICCGSLAIGTTGITGSTECVEGTACPKGDDQLCSPQTPCPTGETCQPLGGGRGGGGTEICRAPIMRPDGGINRPDAGTTMDASAE